MPTGFAVFELLDRAPFSAAFLTVRARYGYNGDQLELRTAYSFSKSRGPQGGIEYISTDRKVRSLQNFGGLVLGCIEKKVYK